MRIEELDSLISQRGAWLDVGSRTDIIVSSRVRLARNLAGEVFPDRSSEPERIAVWEKVSSAVLNTPSLKDGMAFEVSGLSRVHRDVLVERHLVSRELVGKGRGSGVVIKPDESIAVMVNEEDHIRMQAMQPGLGLSGLWDTITAVDSDIESFVDYAFSPSLGYLTACPTNVGTAIRASVMLHLPGLVLMNEITPIIKGINKIGLAVRGLWGEGTDASGNMFQISNQVTLGEVEEKIVSRLEQIVLEVTEHEKNARQRLMEKKEPAVRDHVGRAIGILTHACLLNSRETLDLLSAIRFGIEMGIIKNRDRDVVDELFLLIQPGHLQKTTGKTIGTEKRDLVRAKLVRRRLATGSRKDRTPGSGGIRTS